MEMVVALLAPMDTSNGQMELVNFVVLTRHYAMLELQKLLLFHTLAKSDLF
jgi:hypothetical protein